jgi:hypothetical protein
MVFLTNTGDVFIANESAGTWLNGIWFSNAAYNASCSGYTTTSSGQYWWEAESYKRYAKTADKNYDFKVCITCGSYHPEGTMYPTASGHICLDCRYDWHPSYQDKKQTTGFTCGEDVLKDIEGGATPANVNTTALVKVDDNILI